jgi:hypothetical protein
MTTSSSVKEPPREASEPPVRARMSVSSAERVGAEGTVAAGVPVAVGAAGEVAAAVTGSSATGTGTTSPVRETKRRCKTSFVS